MVWQQEAALCSRLLNSLDSFLTLQAIGQQEAALCASAE